MALRRDGRDPYLPPSEGQIVHLGTSNNGGFEATGATKARKNSFPDTSLLYIPANRPSAVSRECYQPSARHQTETERSLIPLRPSQPHERE